jgi:hypothetical protein
MKMIVEKQMECRWAGETEVLGENLPQHHFCPSENPTSPDSGLNPGRRGGKPVTNRLSYGAAKVRVSLRLAVYRQSIRLGAKTHDADDQRFFPFARKPLRSESLCNILSDERMGLSLMNMLGPLSNVRIAHIARY